MEDTKYQNEWQVLRAESAKRIAKMLEEDPWLVKYDQTHRNAGKVVNAQIYIFEDGSYSAYGAVDQSIISLLDSLT
jgi:hypothetical protein